MSGSYAWNLYNSPGVDGRKKFKLFNDERGNKGKTPRQFKMAVAYSVRDCIYNISQEHGDIILHIYIF